MGEKNTLCSCGGTLIRIVEVSVMPDGGFDHAHAAYKHHRCADCGKETRDVKNEDRGADDETDRRRRETQESLVRE